MRYTDREPRPYENPSPVQSIKYNVLLVLLAPFRLIGTISKRAIFLGDNTKELVMAQIIILTAMVLGTTVWDFLISHNFVLFDGFLPLVSIIVGLCLSIGAYYLVEYYKVDINLEALKDFDKDQALDSIKQATCTTDRDLGPEFDGTYEDSEGTEIDNPDEYKGEKYIPNDEKPLDAPEKVKLEGNLTMADLFKDRMRESIDSDLLSETIDSLPKNKLSTVYKGDKEIGGAIMLDSLRKRNKGLDLREDEHWEEVLRKPVPEDEMSADECMENAEFVDEHIDSIIGESLDRAHADADRALNRNFTPTSKIYRSAVEAHLAEEKLNNENTIFNN